MKIAVLILCILVVVIVHEWAHYRAMKSDGIRTVEAGLGLPVKPMIKVKWRGITWTASIWLLGAYVTPHPEDDKLSRLLPYRRQAWHWGSGVTANLMLASGAAVFAVDTLIAALVLVGITGLIYIWRVEIAAYIQPVLAPVALGLLVTALVSSWMQGRTGMGFTGADGLVPADLTFGSAAGFLALVSFSVAFLNLVPMYPADNGRTVDYLIHQRWGCRVSEVFRISGSLVLVVIVIGSVASDAWALVRAVFS